MYNLVIGIFFPVTKISVQQTSSLYELQVILFLALVAMLLHGAELFVIFEGRGHLRDHLHEIILNLGQWFRRRHHLKAFFSIINSGCPFAHLCNFIKFNRGNYKDHLCVI